MFQNESYSHELTYKPALVREDVGSLAYF